MPLRTSCSSVCDAADRAQVNSAITTSAAMLHRATCRIFIVTPSARLKPSRYAVTTKAFARRRSRRRAQLEAAHHRWLAARTGRGEAGVAVVHVAVVDAHAVWIRIRGAR